MSMLTGGQGMAAGSGSSRSRAIARPAARPGPVNSGLTIGQLYRGHEKRQLIIDIAMGTLTHRELAKREGLALQDIQDFAEEHERDIAECQQMLMGRLAEEVAGLWISNKANRLAEYQEEIEELRDFLAELRENGIRWSRSHRDMLKAYLELFRQVADELGAYPQRASAPARTGQTVHYVIETDDTKALQ